MPGDTPLATQITLAATNIDAMVRFYAAVFGIELRPVDAYGTTLYRGALDGVSFVLCPNSLAGVQAENSRHQFTYAVADLAAIVARAVAAGGVVDDGGAGQRGQRHAARSGRQLDRVCAGRALAALAAHSPSPVRLGRGSARNGTTRGAAWATNAATAATYSTPAITDMARVSALSPTAAASGSCSAASRTPVFSATVAQPGQPLVAARAARVQPGQNPERHAAGDLHHPADQKQVYVGESQRPEPGQQRDGLV